MKLSMKLMVAGLSIFAVAQVGAAVAQVGAMGCPAGYLPSLYCVLASDLPGPVNLPPKNCISCPVGYVPFGSCVQANCLNGCRS